MRVEPHSSSSLLLLVLTALAGLHGLTLASSLPAPLPSASPSPSLSPPSSHPSALTIPYADPDHDHDQDQDQFRSLQHDLLLLPRKASTAPSPPSTDTTSSASLLSWVDYYAIDGTYVYEDITASGDCLTFSDPYWGIINITPMIPKVLNQKDQLILYNDLSCGIINHEPASQTGLTLIAMYFFTVPQSMRWTRLSASGGGGPSPSGPAATTTSPSSSSLTTTPTTTSLAVSTTSLTVSSSSLSTSSSLPTSSNNGGFESGPTPIHTTFPTSLIPPKPLDSSSYPDGCSGGGNLDGCSSDRRTTQVLIVGITVAVLAIGLMAAGSFYIYKTFYTPPESTTVGSSGYRPGGGRGNGGGGEGRMRLYSHSSSSTTGGSGGDDFNDGYEYNHEEDENTPPKFMFNHQRDNIDTNKNPKFFKEREIASASPSSSRTRHSNDPHPLTISPPSRMSARFQHDPSDIGLTERTRK